jgi:hypothetical protein
MLGRGLERWGKILLKKQGYLTRKMLSNRLAAKAAVTISMFSEPPFVLPPTGRGNFYANRIVSPGRCPGLSLCLAFSPNKNGNDMRLVVFLKEYNFF